MSSRTLAVCDGIVGIINAADWSTEITATRQYAARYSIADLEAGVKVIVAPTGRDRAYQARGADRIDYTIDIAVFRHCAGDEAARDAIVDAMIELCEQIEEFWMVRSLTVAGESLMTIASGTDPVYDAVILRDSGVFASVITLGLREVR